MFPFPINMQFFNNMQNAKVNTKLIKKFKAKLMKIFNIKIQLLKQIL